MRILFMGTPDIAADCLKALYEAGHDICGVYTRRDKPVGRKQVLTAPPVKEVALAHGTPVFQPRTQLWMWSALSVRWNSAISLLSMGAVEAFSWA